MSQPAFSRVVLVCAAGRPPGRELALGLARAGCAIAAHDLHPLRLESLHGEVQAAGGVCRAYVADPGKGLAARALIDDVLADFERLDGLVYCLHAAPPETLLQLDEWDWQRALELNLSAPFLLSQAAAAVMRENGGGSIFFALAEDAPYRAGRGAPSASLPLAVARAGIAGLVDGMAGELLTYNIHCALLPGGSPAALEQILAQLDRR
ncbi:MAG: SDR family oxidoreductase [Chloroflexota bacterium]